MNNKTTLLIALTFLAATELFGGKRQQIQQKNDAALKPAIKKDISPYKTRSKRPIKTVKFDTNPEVNLFALSDEERDEKFEHFNVISESSDSGQMAMEIVRTKKFDFINDEGLNYIHQFAGYSYTAGLIILVNHLLAHDIDTLEKMINAKTFNPNQFSALHIAAKQNLPDTIDILLRSGAIIQPDSDSNTPLHYAAHLGFTDCAEKLVDVMTPDDIAIESTLGYTALSLAQGQGCKEIVNLINERLGNNE